MLTLYDVSAEAQNDLFEIWCRIAEDSVDLANRINGEFYDLFASLGRMPGQGHARKDLTTRPVLFFPLYSFLVPHAAGKGSTAVQGIQGYDPRHAFHDLLVLPCLLQVVRCL